MRLFTKTPAPTVEPPQGKAKAMKKAKFGKTTKGQAKAAARTKATNPKGILVRFHGKQDSDTRNRLQNYSLWLAEYDDHSGEEVGGRGAATVVVVWLCG